MQQRGTDFKLNDGLIIDIMWIHIRNDYYVGFLDNKWRNVSDVSYL